MRVLALLDRGAALAGSVSAERRSVMVSSDRARAALMIQRIARAWARSARTSTGT